MKPENHGFPFQEVSSSSARFSRGPFSGSIFHSSLHLRLFHQIPKLIPHGRARGSNRDPNDMSCVVHGCHTGAWKNRADCTVCSRARKKTTTHDVIILPLARFRASIRIIHAIARRQKTVLSCLVDRALLDVMDWLLRDLWRSWSLSDGWMCQEGKAGPFACFKLGDILIAKPTCTYTTIRLSTTSSSCGVAFELPKEWIVVGSRLTW